MPENPGVRKKKPYLKAIFCGIVSIAGYITLFTNQEIITNNFTRGGVYAALPIAAAFIFSFVHGSFASYVLSVLGIEAKKKK
jgi:uncharacterized membrane protein (DUF485 family)